MTNIVSEFKPNKKQQECIDDVKGMHLVLAGPGTGKTFTIINRIKNMIEKGVDPEKILCLTFTDAAVNEMQKRLEKSLGVLSTDVNISTYHGFCCNIINENNEKFELPNNYKVVNDSLVRVFIKECIDKINPKYLRTDKNDPYFYINKIKNSITKIKQYRLTKEQFFENIKQNPDWEPEIARLTEKIEEKIRKNKTNYATDKKDLESVLKKINQAKEIWDFYELYQRKLADNRYLDFNDMINLVLDKFDNEQLFLDEIANKYEYILVDEYQDTNYSQNQIIFNLTHAINSKNVFVVGDDDQIIYRFQGAKLDTIKRFLREFPETKVTCLVENMRSTQKILDTSRAVAKQDLLSLENDVDFLKYNITKVLTAKNEELFAKNERVRCYKYADLMQEYNEIVEEIQTLINSDDCPVNDNGEKLLSQIAILTLSNNEAQEFAQMFKARNIPYELKEGKNIFEINAVNILYFYIQFLISPELYSHKMFQFLLSKPFSINPKDYQVLYKNISKQRVFVDVMRDIPSNKFIEPEKIQKFIENYDYLIQYKSKENIKNTILEIGSKTGIFDYYLNSDINQTENIAGIKKFVDEAISFSEIYKTGFLEEYVDYLKAIILNEEEITTDKSPIPMNAVQLCTYHSSKGREFEYVYMPTLISEKWESSSRSVKEEIPVDKSEYKNADELKDIKSSDLIKLMYVGMTRAKHTLRLSYPMQIKGKNKKPSRFIVNISEMFKTEETPFEYTEQSFWEEMKKTLVKEDYDYEKDYKELIDAKLNDRAFSPSAINRYLACPRQYLYSNILKLDGNDGNPNYSSYGRAIHKACELTVKFQKENKTHPEKEMIIKWFKDELEKLPMEDYNQRLIFEERGVIALDKYYSQVLNTQINGLCEVEYEILDEIDGIKFKGIIDRLDKNEDGTYTIYDYKTGSKKKGVAPDGEHEDYYNQMCLYKYFYEKKYGKKVSATAFLYPEDFTNNLYLNLTDEECLVVVEKFKNAVKNIYDYKFEPSYKQEACKYCVCKPFCKSQ